MKILKILQEQAGSPAGFAAIQVLLKKIGFAAFMLDNEDMFTWVLESTVNEVEELVSNDQYNIIIVEKSYAQVVQSLIDAYNANIEEFGEPL